MHFTQDNNAKDVFIACGNDASHRNAYHQLTANESSLSGLEAALIEKQDDLYLIEEELYELAEKWIIESDIDAGARLTVAQENQLKHSLKYTLNEKRNVQIDIELLINKIQIARDEDSEENTKAHNGLSSMLPLLA
jgi:hypothetical protein